MKDRVSLLPNQRKITPVDEDGNVTGQSYYATVERADKPLQEPTPLEKATLLDDDTAELLGLAVENRTPNNAFKSLSDISQRPIAIELKSTDIIPIVQDGTNKIIKGELLKETSTQLYNASIANDATITLSENWLNFKHLYVEYYTTPYFFNVTNIRRDATTEYGLKSFGEDSMVFISIRFLSTGQIYCTDQGARSFASFGTKTKFTGNLRVYGIR